MIEIATSIKDLRIYVPEKLGDHRGWFMEFYKQSFVHPKGEQIVQANHSFTKMAGTVRGLHFQWNPPMGKYMRVLRGEALLVAVDIREGSPTYGKYFDLVASEENKQILWAGPGFARGFQTLTNDVEIEYLTTGEYNKECEGEIRYDSFGLDWPLPVVELSNRDITAQPLKDLKSKFKYEG